MISIIAIFINLYRHYTYAINKEHRCCIIRRTKKNQTDPPKIHLQNKKDPKKTQQTIENLAHLRQAYEKRLCFVKLFDFQSLRDVNYIMNELGSGNILILNTEPLLVHDNNSMVEVKRAIDQLRGYCREYGGDIKRMGEYTLIVTPNRQYRIA